MLKITHLVLFLFLFSLTIHAQKKGEKPGYCMHDIHTALSCSCPKYYKPFCASVGSSDNQTTTGQQHVTICKVEPDYESLNLPPTVSVQCVRTWSHLDRNPWSVPRKQASAYIPFLESHMHVVAVSGIKPPASDQGGSTTTKETTTAPEPST